MRIAERMGKSEGWVCRMLRFGRFVEFLPSGQEKAKPPKNLSERLFRGYFDRTDKGAKEPRRFEQVLRLMEGEFVIAGVRPPAWVGKAVVKQFADGQWHDPEEIASAVGASEEQVGRVLRAILKYGSHKCHADARPAGKGTKYRILRGSGKRIDIETLRGEVSPIIRQLKQEGKKNMATFSPSAVLDLAHKLEKLLTRLAK